jgi:hypothetical protein
MTATPFFVVAFRVYLRGIGLAMAKNNLCRFQSESLADFGRRRTAQLIWEPTMARAPLC